MKAINQSECDERDDFLAELKRFLPLAKGSLAEVRKPCVRPNCPACASGEKHRAHIFSFKDDKGRRRCMHVPLDFVPTMRKAIRNGRLLEERMGSLGAELILRFRQRRDQTESRGKMDVKRKTK